MVRLTQLTIEGADAATFLQGYVTCDLVRLQPKRGQPMALTDIRGRVIANGWCYGSTSSVAMLIHHSLIDIVKSHLGKYLAFAKSKFTDELSEWSLIADPSADKITLEPYGWGAVPGGQTDNEMHGLMMNHEYPIIQQDTSGLFLPQMLNLTQHGAVSFTKGCYLGQEIVARAQHRGQVKRQLFRTDIPDQNLSIGQTVSVGARGKCTVVGTYLHQVLLVGRSSDTPEVQTTKH